MWTDKSGGEVASSKNSVIAWKTLVANAGLARTPGNALVTSRSSSRKPSLTASLDEEGEADQEERRDQPGGRMDLAGAAGEQLQHRVGDEAERQAVGDRVGEAA